MVHPADRSGLYMTLSADELLERYRVGLVEKGNMPLDEAWERVREHKRDCNSYDELYAKVIIFL